MIRASKGVKAACGFIVAVVPGTGEGSSGDGHHTQKTVAVVVGGVAAAGFGVVCLLFAKSLFKKRDACKYES